MATVSLIVSTAAVAISFLTYGFTRRAWRATYRPIVTARVVPVRDKDQSVNLRVTNSGNRPAFNVQLSLQNPADLESSIERTGNDIHVKSVESCFKNIIDVLANGEMMSSPFGTVNQTDAPGLWKTDPTFLHIKIEYYDLNGQKYDADYEQQAWQPFYKKAAKWLYEKISSMLGQTSTQKLPSCLQSPLCPTNIHRLRIASIDSFGDTVFVSNTTVVEEIIKFRPSA